MTTSRVRHPFALAVTLVLALSAAGCNEPSAEASGQTEGLLIVPVFGEGREDVSAHLDFFGVRAGVVEEEQMFAGKLSGFVFEESFRPDDDGVLPLQDGEIGVSLSFLDGSYAQHGRHVVPAAVDGRQRLEIPIEGARIDLTIEGIGDGEIVVVGYDAPTGGGTVNRGAGNYGNHWYFEPGEITISVAAEGSSERDSRTVTLAAGESAPVTLTVPR